MTERVEQALRAVDLMEEARGLAADALMDEHLTDETLVAHATLGAVHKRLNVLREVRGLIDEGGHGEELRWH